MAGKSFYDLDYMIEINEQRLEQYTSASEKVMERLTNIIVIYSAMSIFLVPIVRMVFWSGRGHWVLNISFGLFAMLFCISVFFAVRLIIPRRSVLLQIPAQIYKECRIKYEKTQNNRSAIEGLLKTLYVAELENALSIASNNCTQKFRFYKSALISALISALPYLVCLGYYVTKIKDYVSG
jgi:hypothetical protein